MPKFGLDDERVFLLINMIYAGSQGHETGNIAPAAKANVPLFCLNVMDELWETV
jgi:hypothetical protein